jgi:hypothetical protein
VVDRLLDYACNHPDPAVGELVVGNPGGGFDLPKANVDTLATNSLNCVRGSAGIAMDSLLRHHPEWFPKFKEAIGRMVQDPHPAVRIAAIEASLPALWIDRDIAIEWFCEACDDDLRVAASPDAVQYFNCGMNTHFAKLAPLVRAMLKSEYEEVVEEGAKEIAARWLFHDQFSEELATFLREGTVLQRKGLADVAAIFITTPEYFANCASLIAGLCDDPDREVRRQVGHAFRNAEALRTPGGVDLSLRFVNSTAFRDDPTTLIYAIESYAGDLLPFADILLSMCREFVGPLQAATRDPSGGVMWDMSHFLPMLVRLYEQANERHDFQTVNHCLDAWDAMFEKRVGVVHELAKAID